MRHRLVEVVDADMSDQQAVNRDHALGLVGVLTQHLLASRMIGGRDLPGLGELSGLPARNLTDKVLVHGMNLLTERGEDFATEQFEEQARSVCGVSDIGSETSRGRGVTYKQSHDGLLLLGLLL